MNNELDEMKRVNIADYLVSQGYKQNKSKSSRNALCYDHPGGDRLIVGTDSESGHSFYCSVRDDQENGTIIDLVQKRQTLNLCQVRKELRPWIGRGPAERPEIPTPQPRPEATTKDRAEQVRALAACEHIGNHHKYLEALAISSQTLEHFRSRIYTDPSGNVVFPHNDTQGVCGLEIKNQKCARFSRGGKKGLWLHSPPDPVRVVVCKSAIDCMSHHQLDHDNPQLDRTLYVSTFGKMNHETQANLKTLLAKHAEAEIVSGFDSDAGGEECTGELQMMAGEREIIRHRPHKTNWNQDLQLKRQHEEERERRRRELENEHDNAPRM